MAVTLSLFAGVAAQFFDNNGDPLAGGKIYSYNAGTTTPLATYTTVSGTTAHTNPIILDSAGRIPNGGEIWLQTGIGYKFLVKNSVDNLIGSYDNVPSSAQAPIANDASAIAYEPGYTPTAGNFVIGNTYQIATLGNTDFTLIGAVTNTVGTYFIATGVGSGSGTAAYSQTVEYKLREIVHVKDFGAVGNGIADDTAAVAAAVAAVAPWGTIRLDGAICKITSTQTWSTKPFNLIGSGNDSGFVLAVGVGNDGIVYGDGVLTNFAHTLWKDFNLYGLINSCRNALILRSMLVSKFINIHVQAGTAASGYGVWSQTAQSCEFNFICDQFYTRFPVSCYVTTNGFRASSPTDTVVNFTDNKLHLKFEAQQDAIYLKGANACYISGLSEGNETGSLRVIGGTSNHVFDFYTEVQTTGPVILFKDGQYNRLGPGLFFGGPGAGGPGLISIQFENERSSSIDGISTSKINIDQNCVNTQIGFVTTFGQVGSELVDFGKNTMQTVVNSGAYQNRGSIGQLTDGTSVLINGSFDRWVDANTLPANSSFSAGGGTSFTRETSIVKQGISSAKVTVSSTSNLVRMAVPTALLTTVPYGRITVSGWIFRPTGGPDVAGSLYLNSGASVQGAFGGNLVENAWNKFSCNFEINPDQLWTSNSLVFIADGVGTYYLDGFSAVVGNAGGAVFYTPNANEFPVYTGQAAWNPGTINDGAQQSRDFTVFGATLGMAASFGAGVDTNDCIVSASVTAADTVTVTIRNNTGVNLGFGNSTWYVSATNITA